MPQPATAHPARACRYSSATRGLFGPHDPAGFGLGIGCKIFGSLGAQWFYQGESLGYRTLYFWIADQDLMIKVQTNSQPPEGTDKLGEAVNTLYEIVRKPKAN
jgi:D-alanyl-D-alanine carboxypeptidase